MSETTEVKGQFGLDQSGGTGKKLKLYFFSDMSDNFKHTYYSKKAVQKQLLNTIVGNHDLICCCDEPLTHICGLIFEQAQPTNFTEEQKKQIRKCLGDGDAAATPEKEDGGFGPGDLEKLFEEDTTTG